MRFIKALLGHNQRQEALLATFGLGINGIIGPLIATSATELLVCLAAGPGFIFIATGTMLGLFNWQIERDNRRETTKN